MESGAALQVGKSAEDYFASGLYCAESVVLAVAGAWKIESDLLPKIATAFCSGMARTGGQCGALSGAIMAVSMVTGRSNAGQSLQDCYALVQQLLREFEREFGARNCSDLLGCDLGTPEGQAIFRERALHERCQKYTGRAAEMAVRVLNRT